MDGQLSRLPVPLPFRAWLNRSWIDLTQPSGPENLTPWGIELAFRDFADDGDSPRFNSIVPTNFRIRVADVARSAAITVAIDHPDEVPLDQRSDRWTTLCEAVLHYRHLEPEQCERLAWLLHRLCFHKLIKDLTQDSLRSGSADMQASLQVTRTISRACLRPNSDRKTSGSPFQALLPAMPQGSLAAAEVTYHLLIEHAKDRPNVTRAIQALEAHRQAVELAAARLSGFRAGLLWSRFFRVRAFVPMLTGDMDGMVRDMEMSERTARGLVPGTEAERYAAAEILWPVLESRVREAQVLGDLPLAEVRARALIDAASLNPRAWLHLGEALLALERFEDAIPVYQEAHRLGPPASEVALFNLGQCHEMLGQAEPAMDSYAELLQIDPFAISAAERISSIAAEYGGRYAGWAGAILNSLSAIKAG